MLVLKKAATHSLTAWKLAYSSGPFLALTWWVCRLLLTEKLLIKSSLQCSAVPISLWFVLLFILSIWKWKNYWTIIINTKVFLEITGELAVWHTWNYDWIRVDMKYSSVVSCRDGMPLKRHWFDKPNKRWWGLIINGSIDDSVWWPWAPSDWMGSLWIMNEEIPDWSVRLSLFQTLSWHFNGASSTGDNTPTTQLQDWSHRCFLTSRRTRCELRQSMHDGKICGFFLNEYRILYKCCKWMQEMSEKHGLQTQTEENTLRPSVTLPLSRKCLDCLSGTQGYTTTQKHRQINTHTHTGDKQW